MRYKSINTILSELDQKDPKIILNELTGLPKSYRKRLFHEYLKNPHMPILYLTRKHLYHDALISNVIKEFKLIKDAAKPEPKTSLINALMSAYAIYSLKCPSLLNPGKFEQLKSIKNTFKIRDIPSFYQMSSRLDLLDPDELYPAFNTVFRAVQRGNVLKKLTFYDKYYILSVGFTGFNSTQTDTSIKTSHQHRFLTACLLHPDHDSVIPFPPEPVRKINGRYTVNSARNAMKSWLLKFRGYHQNLKLIITQDEILPDAPYIEDLKRHNCSFIIKVEEAHHSSLFASIKDRISQKNYIAHEITDPQAPNILNKFMIFNGLSLSGSNRETVVNVLDYCEYDKTTGKKKHYCWITDIIINTGNAYELMLAGRTKRKIENETLNTLKDHVKALHGAGTKYLFSVLMNLMMLAFLIDQIQQITCPLYKSSILILGSKSALWKRLRNFLSTKEPPSSFAMFYNQIITGVLWNNKKPDGL